MGGGYSREEALKAKALEEAKFMSDMFSVAQTSGLMPDIGIDDSLMKFSGLNSTAVLEDYYSQLLTDLAEKAPDYIANLGSVLAAFKCVPNAVGLGALIISLILDLAVISKASKDSDSTLNMMRRVFAEEKASGVRDSMDEYMKRLRMHMNDTLKAQEETERLEKQLSDQLTRLRNSMLHDDQMSSRAMKHWINGAAFHSQMLVHAARLKMARSSPAVQKTELKDRMFSISSAVEIYREDLQKLLKKYKTYKNKTIRLVDPMPPTIAAQAYGQWPSYCEVRDDENNLSSSAMSYTSTTRYSYFTDAYVNYMFDNWHVMKQLDEYFLDLKKNLKELILEEASFQWVKAQNGT